MNNPFLGLKDVPSFEVTSKDIVEGGLSDIKFMSGDFGIKGGQDLSPEISWSGAPNQTKSFIVTLYDPDAPTGSGFWHWAVFNIPASVNELPQGAGNSDNSKLPSGAIQLPNDARAKKYIGAAPPKGHGVHHYFLTVWALDSDKVEISEDSTPAFLIFNVFDHVLARGVLHFEVEVN
ncbi:YbhB/YbcL family Raf kinase inhibitor-like protein [Enterococcus phoeniculicola]|jgi:Raf kinase inhibitor-like YbhB/YbcL family protein|uniref:YbhB/YbcL family Raf kinase inhibitor-like protein n=1 Tax=Enterococcus phoeniculicola ATCC BAA-412 TaxID=1158610 RepID=R3W427_9ENTE|nr:YbhB/YbcL family Raf kinase inhibitor-like protein [Enterococcus phoeniculicola]EOL42261.1 YbhB/YbcL family Raf kinase inhibitor-like protein [Enterococcus phoeniculicola ATCC BAA-412]EOT79460.1 YbhB/YbcL family Raf kinase inhibitor-like protein [Enterococcus phoeniculicola ATCC BAA-412]OJG70170.1 YbhB/YbcL family Raf kinase inhibitor-like protein [Enterococcus phoeniculicola]